ncbi:hypothetical protein FGIG_08614 [Fasciola gigantica]|uniref:Saposin B-type domain-containing protein n=1 Tax=Fasciola gigantica TaxID=46835 RepID=A0A504YK14_FASGI|nr:hypothetical protein FGIG_08614 [Fasciola gigantica]
MNVQFIFVFILFVFQEPDADVSPCEVCTVALDQLKKLLQIDAVRNEVEVLMKGVCAAFGPVKGLVSYRRTVSRGTYSIVYPVDKTVFVLF